MTNPIITIHNIETNKIIKREMDVAELAQYQADQVASADRKAEAEAAATQKAALLARLGITADEANSLIG